MRATTRFATCALLALSATAAAAAQAGPEFPYLATVTTNGENVRAGAHFRYYPFGRLNDGDVIKVIGHKGNWARVVTVGPAFRDFFAYIKYPVTETGHLQLDEDATAGRTLMPVDLFAPNLDAGYEPKSSWKPVLTLPQGMTVTVGQTREVRGERVHRVALPPEAQGWINLDHLRRATPAEHAAFEAALAQRETAAGDRPLLAPAQPQPNPETVATVPVPMQAVTPTSAQVQDEVPRVGQVEDAGTTIAELDVDEIAGPPETLARPASTPVPRVPGAAARKLGELETAYRDLLAEPVEKAEVSGLRLQYLELAREHRSHTALVEYAEDRARQLELWAEVQQRQSDLSRLLERSKLAVQEAREARWSVESAAGFVAIGRLEASRVYDGERLPKLLRLREPSTGRSIAYIKMDDDRFDLAGKIGEMIGIVGDRTYDGTLRLNILEPQRIEVLPEVE
ncbi:MAG: SH3 domain-containing protein [Planctomycetota bacterium]|jgi:hypothetical protein